MNDEVDKLLNKAFADSIRIAEKEDIVEWCESELILPIEIETPWPGPYSADRTPWVRGWYEIIDHPDTRLFAIQKGAQVAATQTFMNCAFYWTVNDPGSLLYVMDSTDVLRDTSKLRLKPIIMATDSLRRDIKSSKDELDNLLFIFSRCFWRLIGANSLGKASSFTHRYLIIEEPEKYKDVIGKEGNVIENLFERVKRIWNHKILINCTPTTKKGFIHKYIQYGDRCLYFVPCPHCHKLVVLRFSPDYGKQTYPDNVPSTRVIFNKERSPVEAARNAYMKCPLCRKRINDLQKREMVDHGIWKPTKKPELTGYRSAVLGGLYPKDESASIRAFTESFLSKIHNQSDLQKWVNSDCGELFEEPHKKAIGQSQVWEIRNKDIYEQGVVPTKEKCILAATVDVQASYLVFQVWAMDLQNHWLIDHGLIPIMEDISDLFRNTYRNLDNDELHIGRGLLDTGYDTMHGYEFCLGHPRIIPIKGETGRRTRQTKPIIPSQIDSFPGGKLFGGRRKLTLLHVHPSYFKYQLAQAVASEGPVSIWFHKDIDEDFTWQMAGEVLKETKPDKYGSTDLYWQKIHKNDDFDLAQYSFAFRHLAQNALLNLNKDPEGDEPPGDSSPDEAAAPDPAPVEPRERGRRCGYRGCRKIMTWRGNSWICKCGNVVRKRGPAKWEDDDDEG